MDEAPVDYFLLSNQGLFRLDDKAPDFATRLTGALGLPSNHTFATLHNRRPTITDRHREIMYMRHGVARTIIDDPARYTWMQGFGSEDKDLDVTLAKVQRVLHRPLRQADIYNRLYGMGFVIMGFNDGRSLAQPLGKANAVTWAHAFNRYHLHEIIYDKDPSSPTYAMPRIYRVKTHRPGTTDGQFDIKNVHVDRVLPLIENPHVHPIYGGSSLDPAWNDLEDVASLGWASAEAYYQNASPKLLLKTPRKLTTSQEAEVDKQLGEMRSNVRDVMKMSSFMELKALTEGNVLPRPLEHFIGAFSLLARATGLPFSFFWRGHLTSGEALEAAMVELQDYVNTRQRVFGRDTVDGLLARLVQAGLATEDQALQAVTWRPPRVETREQIARLARNEATAFATAANTGMVPSDLAKRFEKAPQEIITHLQMKEEAKGRRQAQAKESGQGQ